MSKEHKIWMDDKPEHTHDCSKCVFLGNYIKPGKIVYDLYYCKGHGGGSIIERRSSEGSDYWSHKLCTLISPAYKNENKMASTAIRRAIHIGAITKDELWNAARFI